MDQHVDPGVGAFFKIHRWNENSVEQLKAELLRAIHEDPEIDDASNIGLEMDAEIRKVDRIKLVGSVGKESERQRARRIVEVNTHDEVEVENELSVS